MRGIEREERAAVLEKHAGVAGDDARAELVVEALDDGDGVARRVRGDDGDGVALDGADREQGARPGADARAPAREPLGSRQRSTGTGTTVGSVR